MATKSKSLETALKETFSGTYFFTKYPELANGKDTGNPVFPFVEGGYDSQTIVAETMRFFPVASLCGAGFFIPREAPIEQVEEWLSLGIEKPPLKPFNNDNPSDYESQVNSLEEGSLHVLHPYSKFSSQVYAVNPNLHLQLNTKSNLPNITSSTPKKQKISLASLLKMSPPFVVKKTTGSSGDGVKIVKTSGELNDLSLFLNGDDFFVETFIQYKTNHSLQFLIGKDKQVYFVGYGEQNTTDKGEFEGVVCFLNKNPDKRLLDLGLETSKNVAKTGYIGFLGFDILEDMDGNYHIIDPNIRCTAATPAYLLKDKLEGILGSYVYVESSKMTAETPTELIKKIKNFGGLLLSMSHKYDNMYKFFAMFGGTSPTEALLNSKRFKRSINK